MKLRALSEDKNYRGFTLVEIIIVMAIVAVVIGFGITVGLQTVYFHECTATFGALREAVFRAREKASLSVYGIENGVHFMGEQHNSTGAVLFSEDSYEEGDSGNETVQLQMTNFHFEYDRDILFEPNSGKRSSGSGSFVRLVGDHSSCSRTININSEGAILW